VRLTAAGEKLAAMVLRRHRLIELFLVKVMGMSWAEVHEDAEQLEHAVSDRLIERMDEMLGRPAVDPHGDPIPDAEGALAQQHYYDLLSCPLHTSVVVTRVTDQDADFLRFLENSHLMPGERIEIEARDEAADSVRVRGRNNRQITIGMRAASKLLVRTAAIVAALLLCVSGTPASAQPQDVSRPFEILDNSFLVEEAFNQEPGVFQNIFGLHHAGDSGWEAAFTQEWPVLSMAHQFSYTLPVVSVDGRSGFGDMMLNYRYQAFTEAPGRPAFSPRLSLILPSGDEQDGLGDGVAGWQVNLPFSKQLDSLYLHWNGGFTVLPGVKSANPTLARTDGVMLFTPHLAVSGIWRFRPMVHLMLESVLQFSEVLVAPEVSHRTTQFTLSPGARGGWNIGDQQVIAGLAVPVVFSDDSTDPGVFLYLSYELPFPQP
jgi:hypothetical protein